MYGKLIDGNIVPAPNPLHINRGMVYNPSAYLYASVGYKPIVDTPMPATAEDAEPVYYTSHWEERDGQIVRVWTETEPPAETVKVSTWQETTEQRIAMLESTVDDLIVAALEVDSNV